MINPDLQKRIAMAHKKSITSALMHLGKASECRESGMGALEKAAAHFVEAKKAGKKEMPMDEVAGHLAKAVGHFGLMEDHQSIAEHHISKVANAWGAGSGLPTDTGGGIKNNSQTEMTEGEVPEYTAGEEYDGKGAMPAAFVAQLLDNARKEAAATAKAEMLEKQVDMLSRMPAGSPRARLFALDKTAMGGDGPNAAAEDYMGKLMKGVAFDQNDPDSVNKAAGSMIANMIGDTLNGGKTFGRRVISDPNFRGMAAAAKR